MTDSFVVRAGGPLHGTVRVSGATKNAGTKQMAAALLAPGVTTLRNVDPVADLDVMIDVLRAIGAGVEWTGATELQIDASAPLHAEAPYELVTRMRASINVLGPLLARCGQARVAMPGGDNIGNRKLDMHFRGLEAMGVELDVYPPAGGDPYKVQYVFATARMKTMLSVGMEVPVKVMDDEPNAVAVQWDALKGSIAASGGDMTVAMQGIQNTYAGTADAAGRAYLAEQEAAKAKAAQETAANDPAERLKKLSQLKDAGLVTDEEFETKKAEILSDI